MQTADLVDLALLAALHGPKLVVGESRLGVVGLEEYWAASKCRFDRWATLLGKFRRNEPLPTAAGMTTARGLVEEILGSEVLTRVWTAVVTAFDRRRDTQDNEIVVRSVYIAHQEMRQRVLKMLGGGPGLSSTDAVDLNRLRSRVEQWTDVLLAFLAGTHDVGEFAFDAVRLKTYAADAAIRGSAGNDGSPTALLRSTLATVARHSLSAGSPNSDLNGRIAEAVLGGFSSDLFDDHGLFRSFWVLRLMKTTDDAQRLMTDLLRQEKPSPSSLPFPSRFH